MIKKIFEQVLCSNLDCWHHQGLATFKYEFRQPISTLEGLVERNIYFNYQGWHFEDLGQSDDKDKIIKGWYGSRENNRNRNATIQQMDDYFLPYYSGNAELHTETVGVILDKVSILYIKYLHLLSAKDSRSGILLSIINELISRTDKLYDDIVHGRLRCITIPHLKLYDSRTDVVLIDI